MRRYRRKGPRKTTRWLIEALQAAGTRGATLLDVGCGVGVIQHELLDNGVVAAVGVEAVPAYLLAARDEATRRGHAARVDFRQGDFIELAGDIESADIVTLDRVICCYPDWEALVTLSLAKTRKLYGVVYPRSNWWSKFGLGLLNFLLWLRRNPFRVFAHPTAAVDAAIRDAGFRRLSYRTTPSWLVVVYGRATV
ncbi:MAG: methyltransferase domain-containing protein [Gemmatimonadota bacterium]|nr:MAG: methyltransferase domain-containing protein [Gemmatimonadota bacterium]